MIGEGTDQVEVARGDAMVEEVVTRQEAVDRPVAEEGVPADVHLTVDRVPEAVVQHDHPHEDRRGGRPDQEPERPERCRAQDDRRRVEGLDREVLLSAHRVRLVVEASVPAAVVPKRVRLEHLEQIGKPFVAGARQRSRVHEEAVDEVLEEGDHRAAEEHGGEGERGGRARVVRSGEELRHGGVPEAHSRRRARARRRGVAPTRGEPRA
jgi:hypothetical protein